MAGKNRHRKRKSRTEVLMEEQTLLAEERTVLSKERTILSFVRTALAFIGVGIIIINFFSGSMISLVVGVILIVIGLIESVNAYQRISKYRQRMDDIKKKLGKNIV